MDAVVAGSANEVVGFAPKIPPVAGVAVVVPKREGAAADVWVPNKPPEVVVVTPKRGLFAAAAPKRPAVLAGV